jgi:hypothetical protein
MYYIEDMSVRAAKTIRMREDIYHQAKVAAVVSRKSVGQWIEEAVAEKVRREARHPLLEAIDEAIDSENPSTAGRRAG